MFIFKKVFVVLLFGSLTASAYSQIVTVTNVLVTKVKDGDTFSIKDGQLEREIRLWGVDAPETKKAKKKMQPYANTSTKALKRFIDGKIVDVDIMYEKDQYGRPLGVVYVKGKNINAEMLRLGHGWFFPELQARKGNEVLIEDFKQFETSARDKPSGLWKAKTKPIEPWLWRQ